MKIPLVLLVLLTSAMTGVTTVTAAGKDEAMDAFTTGTKLYAKAQYNEAAESFRKAYELRPSWKILFNIGQCEAAAKEYGLALEAFEAYLSEGGDEVPADKRNSVISDIRIMRELIGYLRAEAPEGAKIMVDDHARGQFPLPGPVLVAAGVNHDVKIEKDGAILFQKTVRINSGNTLELDATAQTNPSDTEPVTEPTAITIDKSTAESPRPNRSAYSKPLRIAGWVTAMAGGGLVIGGAITGVMVLSLNNDLKTKECAGNACDKDTSKLKNLQVSTNVLLAVGGSVALAGVTLLIVSYVQEKRAHKISLTPSIHPANYGLLLRYAF